jgi:hypothetical protein
VLGLIVVVTFRKHAAAYEGTKSQHLEKGDVAYSHISDSLTIEERFAEEIW